MGATICILHLVFVQIDANVGNIDNFILIVKTELLCAKKVYADAIIGAQPCQWTFRIILSINQTLIQES